LCRERRKMAVSRASRPGTAMNDVSSPGQTGCLELAPGIDVRPFGGGWRQRQNLRRERRTIGRDPAQGVPSGKGA
jgi:hypothetical protein